MNKTSQDLLLCKICEKLDGKYSCPRCNIIYCSLECYRNETHSDCSEAFYKECVLEQAGEEECDAESMRKILEKHHLVLNKEDDLLEDLAAQLEDVKISQAEDEDELDSDDSDDADNNTPTLQERFQNVDLDDCGAVWEKLTKAERQDFKRFLASQEASKAIELWTPWWEFHEPAKIINVSDLNQHKAKCPAILRVKPLHESTSKKPDPSVQYNMINIATAYVFTMRYFNGDCDDSAIVATYINELSKTLRFNENQPNFDAAVQSVVLECTNVSTLGIMVDRENLDHVQRDIKCLVRGPHVTERKHYLLSAFSHMFSIFTSARKWKEPDNEYYQTVVKNHALKMISAKVLRQRVKQMQYYIAFIKSEHYNS